MQDLTRRNNTLDAQTKADADTIANLRRQLEQQKKSTSNTENVALQQRRTMDLREVNATLLSLSKEKGFQQVL